VTLSAITIRFFTLVAEYKQVMKRKDECSLHNSSTLDDNCGSFMQKYQIDNFWQKSTAFSGISRSFLTFQHESKTQKANFISATFNFVERNLPFTERTRRRYESWKITP